MTSKVSLEYDLGGKICESYIGKKSKFYLER